MEDQTKEKNHEHQWEDRAPCATTRWLVILSVLLFAAAIFGWTYANEQTVAVRDLTHQNQAIHTAETQMQTQIADLTSKIEQMTAPPATPVTDATTPTDSAVQTPDATPAANSATPTQDGTPSASSAEAPASNNMTGNTTGSTTSPAAKRITSVNSIAQDRRMRRMQAQLTEQKKQLKQTQDDLASARSDLEGKLGSTRDELSGSIARTHDELVSLEKRGERSYYEFDLSKSKSFQHEGPIQISLRKADSKHQSYDLMMLVDDHELSKKKVDLYEPIWLHEADQPQPVQIVINQIGKDHIHGYVSAPKYTESELASNSAQPSMTSNSKTSSTSTASSSSSYSSSTPSSATATSSQEQQPVN